MSSSVVQATREIRVTVSDIRLLDTRGPIRATVTVRYGPALSATTIHGVKVFDSPRGITVGGPQQQYAQDGATRWSSIVTWDRELHQAITEAVTRAYKEATQPQGDMFAEVGL